jgi:hypothetical protein
MQSLQTKMKAEEDMIRKNKAETTIRVNEGMRNLLTQ